MLRRSGQQGEAVKEVKYDKLSINLTNYELKVNGVQVDTPPKEMELIYHLASNPNRVFTRDPLLDAAWGFDYYGDSRTVDVHVKRPVSYTHLHDIKFLIGIGGNQGLTDDQL